MNDIVVSLRKKVKEHAPLIHNITNVVVTNFTANGLYAIGASPVMAYAKEEVADMASIAQALVLNIGTLTAEDVEAMFIAGQAANKNNVPIVLDPVGVGATSYRTETAKALLEKIDIQVVRGNAGEIANLIDENVEMKGVDSNVQINNLVDLAKKAAVKLKTVIVLTGKTDIVTDGVTYYQIQNGDELLTKVTGTGCLLSAVVASFITQSNNILEASAAAVCFYGSAAEVAASASLNKGPGHFQLHFLDYLYTITDEKIKELVKLEKSID
ncbi:hydroxyethylthiazole kinase [Evansella cellulosilytica]|uniref:Hydroxyethylthiazole kinase n=1 Tax=Evansella cellulosilytica (strain ATCC 21833 / DSM 2522 / FERM P-1141 / JCM 9156 / N-4) TaxID=649639 RepID=E6TR93_EVAC2|nr:hydroxyethylthiazole kinase [Evansella cellulosilytica]ADU30605.1 Hydroxyethylthiazole kinase [Evansella cellulosilytica DSM 2522]